MSYPSPSAKSLGYFDFSFASTKKDSYRPPVTKKRSAERCTLSILRH